MLSVKVSTKHQIVVPSKARRALGIKAGDRLTVEVTPEGIVLRPREQRAGARLRGLGREVWQGEELTFRWLPFDEVMEMVRAGQISDALSVLPLQAIALERLREI